MKYKSLFCNYHIHVFPDTIQNFTQTPTLTHPLSTLPQSFDFGTGVIKKIPR